MECWMKDYTPYQKKIISRYYDHREQIDEQRLGELVSSLYLAKPGSKQLEKLWTSAGEAMERLKLPESRIRHVMQQRDPAVLAEVVKDLQTGAIKPG
jgi:hypothetical protein